MKFSENQKRAIDEILCLTKKLGGQRWFIQEEVVGAGYKTMMALVNKGVLKTRDINGKSYYQLIPSTKIIPNI